MADMPENTPVNETSGADAQESMKADILERFLAKLIDFLIVGALFVFPTLVGPLAGLTYLLISDGLKGGQSVGKRIIGLKVRSAVDYLPCDFRKSIIRNGDFGAMLLWYMLIGWIPCAGKLLTALVWIAVVAIEILLIYTDDAGSRFGDRIAGTTVVSTEDR